MGVDLCKCWVVVRTEDNGAVAALSNVGHVFCINEEADLSYGLFAKDPDLDYRPGRGAIIQHLRAAVIQLDPGLKTLVLFHYER